MQHSISSLLCEGGASTGSSSSSRADDDRNRSKNFSIDFLLSTTRRPSSRTSFPLGAVTSDLPVGSPDVAGDLQETSQNHRPYQSDTPGAFQNPETCERTKLADFLASESCWSRFQLPHQAYLQFLEFHEKSKRLQRLHAFTTAANSLPFRHFRSSPDDSGVSSIADVERLRMIGREIRCCSSSNTTNGFRYESDAGQLSELQLRQQAMTSLYGCGVGNTVHRGHYNGSPAWPGPPVLPSPHGLTWPGPHATSAASDGAVGCWTSTRSPPPFGLLRHRRKRIRTAFSALQMSRLESAFQHNKYLVGGDRRMLAFQLGLSETQVKVWFQNRRTKQKRSEWDCDVSDGHPPDIGARLAYSSSSSPPSSSSASSPLTDEFHPRHDVITSADGKMTSSRGIVYSSPDELSPVT